MNKQRVVRSLSTPKVIDVFSESLPAREKVSEGREDPLYWIDLDRLTSAHSFGPSYQIARDHDAAGLTVVGYADPENLKSESSQRPRVVAIYAFSRGTAAVVS